MGGLTYIGHVEVCFRLVSLLVPEQQEQQPEKVPDGLGRFYESWPWQKGKTRNNLLGVYPPNIAFFNSSQTNSNFAKWPFLGGLETGSFFYILSVVKKIN